MMNHAHSELKSPHPGELIEDKDAPFSRTTRWRLRVKGLLPFYRIGRRIYYSVDHFERLLKNCECHGK